MALVDHLLNSLSLEFGRMLGSLHVHFSISVSHLRCLLIWGNAKTLRDEDGNTRTVERSRRIKQWWFVSEAGKVCFSVRYGSRVLELAKGKSAIEVATPAELINALETVRSAVDAGELDGQLEVASNSLRGAFAA